MAKHFAQLLYVVHLIALVEERYREGRSWQVQRRGVRQTRDVSTGLQREDYDERLIFRGSPVRSDSSKARTRGV